MEHRRLSVPINICSVFRNGFRNEDVMWCNLKLPTNIYLLFSFSCTEMSFLGDGEVRNSQIVSEASTSQRR